MALSDRRFMIYPDENIVRLVSDTIESVHCIVLSDKTVDKLMHSCVFIERVWSVDIAHIVSLYK